MPLLDYLIVGVAAFLVGFIIEWIWDSRRRRKDQKAYQQDTAELYAALERANAAKSAAQKEANSVLTRADGLQAQKERLEKEQAEMRTKINKLTDELDGIQVRLRQMTAIEQANETLRGKLSEAEGRTRDLESTLSTVQTDQSGTSQQVEQLRTALERTEQDVAALRDERDTLEAEKKTLRDRLATTEEELATIGAREVTSQDDSAEIDRLAAERDSAHGEIQRLRSSLSGLRNQQERAAAIEKENDELRARLESAENELLTEHNRLVSAEIKLQNMADALTDERMKAQQLARQNEGDTTDSAAALQAQLDAQHGQPPAPLISLTTEGDRLQAINGIGNVFAQRFNEAGVYTYGQLAALDGDRISQIVQAKSWQKIDADSWIDQAKALGGDEGAVA